MRHKISIAALLLLGTLLLVSPLQSMERKETYFSRVTGSGAIAYTRTSPQKYQITEVRLHLDGAATQETLTISIDSTGGATYDSILYSVAMAGNTDVVWRPDQPVPLYKGDILKVDWTNTDAATYGLEVLYEY